MIVHALSSVANTCVQKDGAPGFAAGTHLVRLFPLIMCKAECVPNECVSLV